MLTVAGLGLMGFGGWLYYQQWLEAHQPPPARIIEMSPDDLANPPADLPTLTPIAAAQSMSISSLGDTLTLPKPTAKTEPVAAAKAAESSPAESGDSPPASPSDEALTLADNPLPVVENGQAAAEAAPPAPEASTANRAPLTRIVAESIGLDAPVIEVGWETVIQNSVPVNVWKVADYAAGWHKNSMMPGQGGNVVLSGHHNIKGEVFRYIVDLNPGDVVTLYDEAGKTYQYAVEDKFILKDKGEPEAVRQANARWIGPFNDERLTLVTCWPYTNNTHRVIVISKPVKSP